MEDLTGDQWHQTSFATEDITFYGYMGINKCNYLYFGTAVQQWGQQHSAFYTMLVKFYSWTYALRSCLYYFRCYYTKVICFVFGIDVYRTIKSTRVSSRPCRLYPNNLPIFFPHSEIIWGMVNGRFDLSRETLILHEHMLRYQLEMQVKRSWDLIREFCSNKCLWEDRWSGWNEQ